jgi:hypothetical protein
MALRGADRRRGRDILRPVGVRLGVVCLLGAVLVAGCGGSDDGTGSQAAAPLKTNDPGPIHVHGLGVNPADGALFIATHTGLFRAAEGERHAERVAGRYQDTMGFTVMGRDHFLGSGHPDLREHLPSFLGLIESRDAGKTWKPVSLLGKQDFHVLEATGERVYGFGSDFETRNANFLVSSDGGRSWDERKAPEALIALAIDPSDRDRIVASSEARLYTTSDAGRDWRPLGGEPSFVVWPTKRELFAVALDGGVSRSDDVGRTWQSVGQVAGEPAAFEAHGRHELYIALHDGTVKRSGDGGRSWVVRSAP